MFAQSENGQKRPSLRPTAQMCLHPRPLLVAEDHKHQFPAQTRTPLMTVTGTHDLINPSEFSETQKKFYKLGVNSGLKKQNKTTLIKVLLKVQLGCCFRS